ncbi:valine--tRNA ligase [Eubacteriales bacterium KG127]
MSKNLAKNYNPKEFEQRIYQEWEEKGLFTAEVDKEKIPYTIVMPPPNITGQLHMGHALDHTLQDVLIRWKRLQGFSALWLPGSDHASIATEVKVVEKVKEEEGLTKDQLGREEFLKRAWKWKEEYGGRITQQCRRLGDSCDWSRERFTMDEGCSNAVRKHFMDLYKKGYIYRGNRLINWCPDCGTSLSDAEVEHEDKKGLYWYFRYPAACEGGKDIIVATSRPETMFGDIAIAVNPKDEKYKDMIGQMVILPIVGREIPIIADPYPDPEKGTGAVKITPAHDPNDFEVGQRHNLEVISCINLDGTMNEYAGKYHGMDRFECRKKWVKDLDDAGFLVKTEDMDIPVGTCYRCGTVIEPMLSDQWFVKMEELAKPAIEAAKNGTLTHVPERFEKIYLHWLEDIRDWCISRQLWWGHRIPAWYCQDCGEIIVAMEEPDKCTKCNSKNLKQDEDVLDTWFSSALWPFSTLGWPENSEDLNYFYPTNVLVTAYDIIFFWVVRMVFSSIEVMGEVPFKDVYIHGLVRDSKGQKMSKSLGNGIDPLEIIDQYGADALRFMLSTGTTPGNDMRFQTEKLESARNFANKLWNASRFVIMNITDEDDKLLPMAKCCAECCGCACGDTKNFSNIALKSEDKWILSKLNQAVKEITINLENYEIALAGQKVYDLIWNNYCDWYIEMVKKRLWGEDENDKQVVRFTLIMVLKNLLKLLHPFMPFITEEIWGYLPHSIEEATGINGESKLIASSWPEAVDEWNFNEEEKIIEKTQEIIKAIRNIRAEVDAPPSKTLDLYVTDEIAVNINLYERYIREIGNINKVVAIESKNDIPKDVMSQAITGGELFVPLADLIDYKEEEARLSKEKKKLEGEVARVKGKLSNQGFISKAPKHIIEEEKSKLANYEELLEKVSLQLELIQEKLR